LQPRFRWGIALTVIVALVIAWFTLNSAPREVETVRRLPFACLYGCGGEALRDAVLNVVMFMPLGLALALWLSPLRAWLITVGATLFIEFAQHQWLVGRDASLRDILSNSLGGALGVALVLRWTWLVFPRRRISALLGGAALAGWLLIVGLSALAARPSLPRTDYWGQWAPVLGQFAIYGGRVLEARVNDWPLPDGRVQDSPALRRRLLGDSVLIIARVVSGPPPDDPAPIASIFDGDEREIAFLGQSHEDLVFRIRTGYAGAELRSGMLALPRFPGRAVGDTVTLTGGLVRGRYLLRAESGGAVAELVIPLSAGWGWTGLLPFGHVVWAHAPLVTALWLGVLLLPAGYWLGRGCGAGAGLAGLALTTILGLAVLAPAAGLPLAAASEFLGSGLGAAAGWLAGRAAGARRRERPRDPPLD